MAFGLMNRLSKTLTVPGCDTPIVLRHSQCPTFFDLHKLRCCWIDQMTSYSRITKAINQRKLFLKKDLASIDFCVIKPSILSEMLFLVASRIVSRDSGSSGQTFCKVNQIFGDELSASITTAAGGGFFTVSFFSFFVSFLLYNLGDGEPSISPSLPLFSFSFPNSHSCLRQFLFHNFHFLWMWLLFHQIWKHSVQCSTKYLGLLTRNSGNSLLYVLYIL